MCERRNARKAQDAAAEALTLACLNVVCPNDPLGAALQVAFDEVVREVVPARLAEALEKLR